ncbi:transposase [Paludicola sp. MB14-C6]|uniref:transposase n=1 Tax=Paludihabitans sp. MB14-C6 TaxID=3070656 RepID=UPI0027DCA50B|nr:transposase [Paludicola sp. MB14-C6]WMJ21932.1 transposase [Paludicola sp. MB14-C6]
MKLPKRKSNRLNEYNYSKNGAYFVTICVKDRHELFWKQGVGATLGRPNDTAHLSIYGNVVNNEIKRIEKIYNDVVVITRYVIMPNHIHLVICLQGNDGRPQVAPTISRVIQQFKGSVTKQLGFPLWQKLFHDHIIRNEDEYFRILQYIENNPFYWEQDLYYKPTNP